MLTILHPEIIPFLSSFSYGLFPIRLGKVEKFVLIIKANKETLLTAKTNNEFKLYLIPNDAKQFDPSLTFSHLGIISAFFDDQDEPLVLVTPLIDKDIMASEMQSLLAQDEIEVYFFDELNRKFLGVKAANKDFNRLAADINAATFPNLEKLKPLDIVQGMFTRFGIRDQADDEKAYMISFGEKLFQNDFVIDLQQTFAGFNDSDKNIAVTSLVRQEDPGPMQEKDIALLMTRVFKKKEVFVNPFRTDAKTELTDVLVVTDHLIILIQAKDSPNTEDSLGRTIDRKRKTIHGHIKKALDQLLGAITQIKKNTDLELEVSEKRIAIPYKKRQIIGLIVVRELFDDEFQKYSTPILEEINKQELPLVLLDYSQLHILTSNLTVPGRFVEAIYRIVDTALQNNEFPRLVWLGRKPD